MPKGPVCGILWTALSLNSTLSRFSARQFGKLSSCKTNSQVRDLLRDVGDPKKPKKGCLEASNLIGGTKLSTHRANHDSQKLIIGMESQFS